MRSFVTALPMLCLVAGCTAVSKPQAVTTSTTPSTASLPVRSVRLYETGVGYFEREGKLSPGAESISLPASHVDDALKTLIVLSDGAPVRVSAVEFESVLSEGLARAQAGLPPAKGQRLTYPIVLESLRGLEVEVTRTRGETLRGRLVDVTEVRHQSNEKTAEAAEATEAPEGDEEETEPDPAPSQKTAPASGHTSKLALPRYGITLLTPDGGVVRLDSLDVTSLRPTDPALAARLLSAVGTASERGAQARRVLRVSATAHTPVRIGYIAETPVWRVTYRLLLSPGAAPSTLQGWVLVHNDTDEAWRRVSLEIVNGRPDSYLFPLTAPRYLRRPLSTPEEMSTLPQLASRTVDQIWGDHDDSGDADDESFGTGGLGLLSDGYTGQGFGAGHGRLGGSHASGSGQSNEIRVGNLAQGVESEAVASGARFHYRMLEPVTLRAHSSALVPFTRAGVGTELMTRFAWSADEGRVSVQITNSSAQTLPPGPLAIYEASGFVGETLVSRLVPGQATWVSYGVDLDVEFERDEPSTDTSSAKLLTFEGKELIEHFVRHREQSVRIQNRSALARSVCLELPVGVNATVQGTDRLAYDRDSKQSLGVFELKPRSRVERVLILDEARKKSQRVDLVTDGYLADLAASKDLKPGARAILLEGRDFLVRNAQPIKARKQHQDRIAQIDSDTERLQRTIEKLKGTSGNGAEPLVRRLVELEVKRNRLELELRALADADAKRVPALTAILERLNALPKTESKP